MVGVDNQGDVKWGTAGLSAVFVVGVCTFLGSAHAVTDFCKADFCSAPPVCSNVGGGEDFSGRTFTNVNFGARAAGSLKGANFKGATLIGVNFAGQDLSHADFTGAVFRANKDGTRTDLSNTTLTGTCFSGAGLAGADLQFAAFDGTDFTCADALDAKFGPLITVAGSTNGRTTFDYTRLGIARSTSSFLFPLENMSAMPDFWARTSFTCTRFVGLGRQNFTPAGKDMSDAVLRGIVLDGFSFFDDRSSKGATLDRADLSYSSFKNANLTQVSLDGSTLQNTDLSGATLTKAVLFKSAGSDLTLARLNNAILNYGIFDHATLTGAQIHGMQSVGASFANATFQATERYNVASVIGSSFRQANFADAALNNVTFSRSDLSGAQLTDLTLSGTGFGGSTMVGSNFENSLLQDVDFTGAYLNNANFKSTRINARKTGAGVNFTCSQLGGASFQSAALSKANFQAAVMPPDAQCCPQLGGGYFCGDAVNGTVYGHTTLPTVPAGAAVTCPNGRTEQCSGSDWSIPGWKTDLCNAAGQTQLVWIKPNCDHHQKTVDIPDANLKACLQQTLYGGAVQPVTKKAADSLKFLSCANSGVADLTGLEKENFPALVMLDLSANQLSGEGDFSRFSEQLEVIKLSYNQYSSLVFSAAQTNLNHLEASNNRISSVTVSPNSYLSYIDLSHNRLAGTQDFFALAGNNVSYLDLSFNQITGIGQADVLTEANSIYLENNRLTTIGSVKSLWDDGNGSLFYLQLDKNACFQCGTLGVSEALYAQFGCSCDANLCGTCN